MHKLFGHTFIYLPLRQYFMCKCTKTWSQGSHRALGKRDKFLPYLAI